MAGKMIRKPFISVVMVVMLIKSTLQTLEEDIDVHINNRNNSEKSLSRKRRYLVFPEGSNLQLVYCLTMPSIGMGKIFTIGTTAALAWELPTEPFKPFSRAKEDLQRIDKKPAVASYSSGGWTSVSDKSLAAASYSKTYYNPLLPNQAAYTTINGHNTRANLQYSPASKNGYSGSRYMPVMTHKRPTYSQSYMNSGYSLNDESNYRQFNEPITTYVPPEYHHIHRRTRRDLYKKLESLLTTLSRDGKACLLKSVCEVSQASKEKGTFMEEIIKVIFRAKPHDDYEDEDDYDRASNKDHNCTERYPSCEHSVWGSLFWQ